MLILYQIALVILPNFQIYSLSPSSSSLVGANHTSARFCSR